MLLIEGGHADLSAPLQPERSVRWVNCVFMAACALLMVTALPWYIIRRGLTTADLLYFLFWVYASGMGITVGYHRLFSHRAYKANLPLSILAVFFGSSAFQQSVLDWAAQHRRHHARTDQDEDPYSIKRGFFYAHVGWVLLWKQPRDHSKIKDLCAEPLLAFQHRYFFLCVAFAGIVVPVLAGWLITGHALGSFLLSVAARVTVVYHCTFAINSFCHKFGDTNYDPDATARDHWLVALLTFGEGYHNFHHRFPSDYRNGVRWYHYDPSKWMIAVFSWVGFARDLKRAPQSAIEGAHAGAGRNARASL